MKCVGANWTVSPPAHQQLNRTELSLSLAFWPLEGSEMKNNMYGSLRGDGDDYRQPHGTGAGGKARKSEIFISPRTENGTQTKKKRKTLKS